MNKEQAIEWLKEFIFEIDSQDNRATAKPIQFLLQQKKIYVAHDDYTFNSKTVYHHHCMEDGSCETYNDAIEKLKNYGYEGDELDSEIKNIKKLQICHYWETIQSFFTEKGVKRHVELNGHNLGEYRSYVVHSFRNPEIKCLFEAIRAMVKE